MLSFVGINPKLRSGNWLGQVTTLESFFFVLMKRPPNLLLQATQRVTTVLVIFMPRRMFIKFVTHDAVLKLQKRYTSSPAPSCKRFHCDIFPKWNFSPFIPSRLFSLLFRRGRTPPGDHPLQQQVVCEICALPGYYAASCGNCLPTFRNKVSVPSSRVQSPFSYSDSWPVKMGPILCPETLVSNYHMTPRNIPEERRTHQHRGGSLKSSR
jgi:hypothetical protein